MESSSRRRVFRPLSILQHNACLELVDRIIEIASTALAATLILIHTYLQIGDKSGRKYPEPFQRFAIVPGKPLKRFRWGLHVLNTQLKQGVNENSLAKPLLHVTSSLFIFHSLWKADFLY